MKQYENYTTDAEGWEHHPAFGMVSLHRISASPGAVMFQSDVRHGEYMRIAVHEADRNRNLQQDWVHPGRMVCEISLSMAQFASFVASTGQGSGVPCTIEWTGSGSHEPGDRPGLVLESRLAMTTSEARAAADEAFKRIQTAEAAYEAALNGKAPAAERKQALANLRAAISNAAPNVEYAAKKLTEHTEKVVETARADIEAMAVAAQRSQQPAIESGEPGEWDRLLDGGEPR